MVHPGPRRFSESFYFLDRGMPMLQTEAVKIKVIHLLRRIERIDRDLEELERLEGAIQQDREYSERLRESLSEESGRLHQLRKRILDQVVRGAPERQAAPGKPRPKAAHPTPPPSQDAAGEPEIILPTRRKARGPARVQAPAAKTDNGAGRKKLKKSEATPFQFRYN